MKTRSLAMLLAAIPPALAFAMPTDDNPVTITGGHDLGKDDHGRPCVLIAAALGVKAEVFREAFSGVTPARSGRPSGEEARQNKEALLKVLAPHGVTNERLDVVSDYYRFKPQDNELWRHRDAKAKAVVKGGKLVRVELTEPGAGYTAPPKIMVTGFENAEFSVTLRFDKNLKRNGGIKAIEVK